MLKSEMEKIGTSPQLLSQFLRESIEIVEQLNEELLCELDPITYAKNKVMIAQIRLLISYLS